tara:strand:+ start:479 stop:667 length:189 start_codon:yes stop_codon:yes gene_type:complete
MSTPFHGARDMQTLLFCPAHRLKARQNEVIRDTFKANFHGHIESYGVKRTVDQPRCHPNTLL